MSLAEDMKQRFSEFDHAKIDIAEPFLLDLWPALFNRDYEKNKQAVLYLSAHIFVTEFGAGAPGGSGKAAKRSLSSKSAGGVSGTYETIGMSLGIQEEWLRTTRYGQMFLLLTNKFAQGAIPV